jgi:DNA-binding NarL/FixJ family response regulator
MSPVSTSRPIRVMLVDDHPVLRAGLANLLAVEADLAVVAQAGSGEAALRLFQQHKPDVCLLDLSMPGMGGTEALTRMRKEHPTCRVIVLTSSETADAADRALAAGASGYLTKAVPFPEIVATIRDVHRGVSGIRRGVSLAAHAGDGQLLSPREYSVLLLLRRGFSNPEIGRSLGISERTVKWHVKSILEKLGETDRTGAVAKAFDLGILRAETPGR